MRTLIQRVASGSVKISNEIVGKIDNGLVVLVGIESDDNQTDIDWIVQKLIGLRIFNDLEGKMNLSIGDVSGELLVVSQFTLHASTKKGNRPSFIKAARPETAIPLYETFISELRNKNFTVATGRFGADMEVTIVNDGPVTIWLDSKNKE
jgi:D-tyrosyl-tRNA(Tyr) deacylase